MFSKVVLTCNYFLEMSSILFIKDQATPLCVSAVDSVGPTLLRGELQEHILFDSYPWGYLKNTQ